MVEKFLLYLQYEKRFSPHTVAAYHNDLLQLQDYLFQTYHIEILTNATYHFLRSWIVDLTEKEYDPRSINRKIASVKAYYKFCERSSILSDNPATKLRSLKTAKKLPIYITEPEILHLLDHVSFEESFEGLRDKMVLELLYGTGIRLAELINLEENDINMYSSSIKVTGKGNKERIIPINHTLLDLIKKYLDQKKSNENGNTCTFFIVTDNKEQAYPVFIYRLVKKYLSIITSHDKKSPHVLRHTFATHLLNKGAELNAIKDLLGHSSLAATQVYTHNSIDKLKAIFEKAHPKA